MAPVTLQLVLTAHLIGVFLWIGGMIAMYWMLRFHDARAEGRRTSS